MRLRSSCIFVLLLLLARSSLAQSNIVFNGGFEQTTNGWVFVSAVIDTGTVAAEGYYAVRLNATNPPPALSQTLQTVPGRDYVVSFAYRRLGFSGITAMWNGASVTTVPIGGGSPLWAYVQGYVHANSDLSILAFNGPGAIDDVKVGWVQEPATIIGQPESRSAYEADTVSFSVEVSAAPPVQYQWFFNGSPIDGANERTFTVAAVRAYQVGEYSVFVSNTWNSVTSDSAQLQLLDRPSAPILVAQPAGELWPAGYGCSLTAFAIGNPTPTYQWHLNGSALQDATNSSLLFASVQPANAGTYTVLASNVHGTVLSLPAELLVTNSTGGGSISIYAFTNNTPVYDVDGTTRLDTNFTGQIYAGAAANVLRPVGAALAFGSGSFAGFLGGNRMIVRQIPDVPSGQTAYVQLRAWQAASGSSYEQARALGGKFGFSAVYSARTGSRAVIPSFSLRAGEPFFVTGILSIGERLPDDSNQFILKGEKGARYLIEKREPPHEWLPFLVLTNTAGNSFFSDTLQNRPVQFYRARMLD